jgi:hypothetical protein
LCAAVEYDLLACGPVRAVVIDRDTGAVLAEASLDLVVGGEAFEWIPLGDGLLALDDAQGRGLFAGGAVWADAGGDVRQRPDGTRQVMASWRLSATAAFRDALPVAVRLPDDADRAGLGLFLQDAKGKWSFLGGEVVEASDEAATKSVYLRGKLDEPGVVAVLRDVDPPYLGSFAVEGQPLTGVLPVLRPRVEREFRGITLPRWPTLELPLVDAGAGLSASGVVAELDGKPFPARWDPEAERLYFDFDLDPGEGVHRARVVATDDLGNTRESRLQFELRDF